MNLTTRQATYLGLAGIGLVATWYYNLQFMAETGGFDLMAFMHAAYANAATTSLSNDLFIGCIAFLVWSFAESRRLGMSRWWVYLVLTLAVAFAFAFPLFLFMRDRRVQEREHAHARL